MLEFFEERYGRYPFNSYGAIVDDDSVGYALETQTRSFFSRNASVGTVAHELAHQWMGDHVSPVPVGRHLAERGLGDLLHLAVERTHRCAHRGRGLRWGDGAPADDTYWDLVVATQVRSACSPGRSTPAGQPPCTRCARRSGTATSSSWRTPGSRTYGGGTASTADFIALAERVSNEQLDTFFETWLAHRRSPSAGDARPWDRQRTC